MRSKIKFVIYLSGGVREPEWHRNHDSVAASVTVPSSYLQVLLDRGDVEEGDATVDVDALADAAWDSEWSGDPGWSKVAQLCTCEECCGQVHIITHGRV